MGWAWLLIREYGSDQDLGTVNCLYSGSMDWEQLLIQEYGSDQEVNLDP